MRIILTRTGPHKSRSILDDISSSFFLFTLIMMNVSSELSLQGIVKAIFREVPFLLACLYFHLAPDELEKKFVIIVNHCYLAGIYKRTSE